MAEASHHPEVHIDADRLIARLELPLAATADRRDPLYLIELARERGVQITDAVTKAVARAVTSVDSDDPYDILEVIAEGTPAVHGEDGRIEFVEGFDPRPVEPETVCEPERAAPAPAESDREEVIDHYEQTPFLHVEAGAHVCTVYPRTEGSDGLDVTGAVIPAVPGRTPWLRVDELTLDVLDDGRVFTSIAGLLVIRGNDLKVARVLEVDENVDFSTGHIRFEGSARVRRNVCDRFVVRVTEDLDVNGLVEAATLIVGGNLHLHRGMAAKERGQIFVDGCVYAGYLDNVRGRIKGDVHVLRELYDCELMVGGRLIMPHGSIVGGRTIVTGTLDVGSIGSDGEASTTLTLGEAPMVSLALHRLERLLAGIERDRFELMEQLAALTDGRARISAENRETLTELNFEISELIQRVEAGRVKRRELHAELQMQRCVDVRVRGILHEKVALRFRGRDYCVRASVRGPLSLFVDDQGGLCYRTGDEGTGQSITNIATAA